ncbi:transporter [Reichenbachiella sp. 5M10]|nr:transporter [Reichenbachiella sp. 5M10]
MGIIWIGLWLLALPTMSQSLEEYLQMAGENNPGLKAEYAAFEAAMQRVAQTNALPDPTLSFGYFVSPIETRLGPQQAKLSLMQMFPWFGTLRAKEDAATRLAEAKYQLFLDARYELFFQVKQAYYLIYEVREHIRWQEENLEILSTYKALATTAFSSSNGSMVDVIRTDIMMEDTRTNIRLLEQQIMSLELKFNRLLHRPDSLSVVIVDTLALRSESETEVRDSLLARHPRVQALELQQQAAESSEILARKSSGPQFGVGLEYAFVGQREDMEVPHNGRDVFMPMVTMTLPMFRGKYKAAVREAQFSRQVLESQKAELTDVLTIEYEMALYALQQSAQLFGLYEEQVVKTKQAIDLLYSAYSNSGKDLEEVLRMQQQLLRYEMEKATAIKNHRIAQAQLDYLTTKSE